MNVLSDISFGDPWGMRSDRDETDAILTRSQRGQTVLEDAVSAEAPIVEPVEPDAILIGQTVNSRQRLTGRWRPRFGGKWVFLADFGFSAAWHDKRNMRHARRFANGYLQHRFLRGNNQGRGRRHVAMEDTADEVA